MCARRIFLKRWRWIPSFHVNLSDTICFYWEGTYGIVWCNELTTQMKQTKGITFHCCMSACMHVLKIYFNQGLKINVDNCGLHKSWPSQKHSVACHKMVTSFTTYKYIPANVFQNTTAASFLLDEKVTGNNIWRKFIARGASITNALVNFKIQNERNCSIKLLGS